MPNDECQDFFSLVKEPSQTSQTRDKNGRVKATETDWQKFIRYGDY